MTPNESPASLVLAAARNNAEWCAVMSAAHGVTGGGFGPQSWAAPTRTPPYYPDAVTLTPGADPAALVARIDTATPGASVKDSFADLELTGAGFRVLFEAAWIHRPAGAPATASGLGWEVVRDPDALRTWALAWDDGAGDAALFPPALLADPDTFVLAGRHPGDRGVVAGAVAGRAAGVIGVSNVFRRDDATPDTAWPFVLEAVHHLFPGLPVVGYEHGEDLTAALAHGFATVGPLRIWLHG
ncbi:hypothetical protein SXIM_12010 [Streptomyces xiamenensis]|uniref:Uncharacterized protein n=2 Tax=Streptomyces xiamenensis TaxID=408015 RepID=A0A0F7FRM1_9ACTN|nr:hypothetical protein SXIM_12010 [Streptomyces xiamenensis]